MKEYHKIQTVFLRDPETRFKTLLYGQFALQEFAYLAENDWVFTEKVDGTNIRVMFDGERISFGGKTDNASIPAFLVDALQKQFLPQIDTFRNTFETSGGVCLYGEGYGAKIQKGGGNYRKDSGFVLFDIRIGDWWLERNPIVDIAEALGVEVVPIIGHGTLYDMVKMARDGFPSRWGDFIAEGIVARPAVELANRAGHRIITKVKHRDFGETP